jgi:hypothetical protein
MADETEKPDGLMAEEGGRLAKAQRLRVIYKITTPVGKSTSAKIGPTASTISVAQAVPYLIATLRGSNEVISKSVAKFYGNQKPLHKRK